MGEGIGNTADLESREEVTSLAPVQKSAGKYVGTQQSMPTW